MNNMNVRVGNILSARKSFSLYDFRKVTDANFKNEHKGLKLKPIPLSPDLLQKVGIKNKCKSSRVFLMGEFMLKFKSKELVVFEDQNVKATCVYLRELQNIYYNHKGEDYKLSI